MTPDSEHLLGPDALGDAAERLRMAVVPLAAVLGWATVELDRAEIEVGGTLVALGEPRIEAVPDDRVLGARCRLLRFGTGLEVLLLEPSTEGRLAAALARHGEGGLVLYLIVDSSGPARARRAGFTLSSEGQGPLGPERLVVARPTDRPLLILAGFD